MGGKVVSDVAREVSDVVAQKERGKRWRGMRSPQGPVENKAASPSLTLCDGKGKTDQQQDHTGKSPHCPLFPVSQGTHKGNLLYLCWLGGTSRRPDPHKR